MRPAADDVATFRALLDRAVRAELARDRLIDLVLRDHDGGHTGNARWCAASACRAAADHARR